MLQAIKPRRSSRWKKPSSFSAFIALAILTGCNNLPPEAAPSNRPYVHKVDEFLPLNGGQTEAVFSVDGTTTDYKLKTVREGAKVSFFAISHDMIVDEETYEVSGDQVVLRYAAGEEFQEPIPLMKFPLTVGDEYQWKGTMLASQVPIQGSAKVVTSTDFVRLKDKGQDAIKVEINLTFGKGANRKLSFWFVKGQGVLRTEMGKNVREPKV